MNIKLKCQMWMWIYDIAELQRGFTSEEHVSFVIRLTHYYALTFQSHSNICFFICLMTTHLLWQFLHNSWLFCKETHNKTTFKHSLGMKQNCWFMFLIPSSLVPRSVEVLFILWSKLWTFDWSLSINKWLNNWLVINFELNLQ